MARRESQTAKSQRLNTILDRLAVAYPDARVGLDFTSPLELLIATILSLGVVPPFYVAIKHLEERWFGAESGRGDEDDATATAV